MLESDRFKRQPPTLSEFLKETGLELTDVYKNGFWSQLKRAAGVSLPAAGPQENQIGDALGRMLHIDDPLRLDAYRRWLSDGTARLASELDGRIITSVVATVWQREMPASLDDALAILRAYRVVVSELLRLLDLLDADATHLTYPLTNGIPLSIHVKHSLIDVFAAIGRISPGEFYQHREGVYYDEATNTDLFFVTLKKSDREYSKSTLYKDYAISPTLFHWSLSRHDCQVANRAALHPSPRSRRPNPVVREAAKAPRRADDHLYPAWPVEYVSHQNERPIQFTLRLQRPTPADLFRQAKVAAG